MLILINKCLLNVAQHDKSTERSKFPQAKSPPRTFQSYLENLVCLNVCFPLFSNPFLFQTL